jgi:hypothetical protein
MSGCLVFTPIHDQAIEFGFGITALAFLLSLWELSKSGFSRLAWLGLWPLFAGALNFSLWELQWVPIAIPVVQKGAILGFMIWQAMVVLVISWRWEQQDLHKKAARFDGPDNPRAR